MSKRSSRGFIKKDEVLEKLEKGRMGVIQVCTEAKINSPEYRAAGAAIKAIDTLAEVLTGDNSYFHLTGHSPKAPPRQ